MRAAPLAQIKRGGLVRFAPEGSGGGLCRVCSESGRDAATVRHRDLTSGNGLASAPRLKTLRFEATDDMKPCVFVVAHAPVID